jgi:hypothetical protein
VPGLSFTRLVMFRILMYWPVKLDSGHYPAGLNSLLVVTPVVIPLRVHRIRFAYASHQFMEAHTGWQTIFKQSALTL